MVIHWLLLKVVVLGAVLGPSHNPFAAEAAADSMTKPGCRSTCGNISIPYPFGLTDSHPSCRNGPSSFAVECDNSTDPPTPYWYKKNSTMQVLNISLEDHEIYVNTWVGRGCYNSSGYDARSSFFPRLRSGAFPMSNTKNQFIAVGCDTAAYFLDRQGDFAFGCMSICNGIADVTNGSCSGIGCCKTSIPRNSFGYKISIDSYNNHTDVLNFNPCSYAFVAASGFYNFSSGNLSRFELDKVPLVLDWAVGKNNCDVAMKSPDYMCTENTYCTNAENGRGYKCACSKGFHGNPYLANGCQDIDECADPNRSPCYKLNGTCTNVVGGYHCSC